VKALLYREGTHEVDEVAPDALDGRPDDHSILWVDASPDSLDEVATRLGLGDDWRDLMARGDVIFRGDVVHAPAQALRDVEGPIEIVPLHLVLARNTVISIHEQPIQGMADPIEVVAEDPRFGRLDAGRFAGLLLDGVLHRFDAAIEDVERDIDHLDDRLLGARDDVDALQAMVQLRRRIATLRRGLAPQRAVFSELTRSVGPDESPIGQPDAELMAHLDRALDSIERARQQLLGTFDIAMTRTSQRTNDIVKVLTIVSAVLLPAAVIAGIMGMNFEPTFFDEPSLFYVVLAAMVALALGTLVFARWRRWI
jgi:Mg2+ and Co2+ transporter CorA